MQTLLQKCLSLPIYVLTKLLLSSIADQQPISKCKYPLKHAQQIENMKFLHCKKHPQNRIRSAKSIVINQSVATSKRYLENIGK